MSRHAVQRILTLLTLALALVVPLRARAAIVPVCEDDRMTIVAPPDEPSCTVLTSVDDVTGETRDAPICDPRGASAVAPPRILPITDARIDAAPGCDGGDPWPKVGPSSRHPAPASELASAPPHAVLVPDFVLPAPGQSVATFTSVPPTGGPRSGVEQGVYHPPR
ncbi:hypothetical protein SOCEGT47_026720 [Sorangium cellulosum]|jgi:hypothetical protein|uniref:Secreted protein n=1 Tax=Sorangium cellulosum TaxID=56 RepID=A0A4P2PZK7_SORCE|nr:hypothetical protein [Sorangium cellulosum]AUX22171.1 hypothetical protein SOCEGT47_026720 [Sorangium cellulosum]